MLPGVTSSGPATRYYDSLLGAWHGAFRFRVTDPAAIDGARSPRALLRAMSLASRELGPATFATTLSAGERAGEYLHTTRVSMFGIPALTTSERIVVAADGSSITMTGEQIAGLSRGRYDADGEVDGDALGATYRIAWLGAALVQRTRVTELGLSLVQQTPFSRAEVLLRRR